MNNSQGFSLIEVLITLVLTVIGVLGMVAMQTKAIQYTNDSVTRTAAVIVVDDLLEILRSNRDKIYDNKSKIKNDSAYFKTKGTAFSDLGCNTYDNQAGADTPDKQLCVWAMLAKAVLPGVTDEMLKDEFFINATANKIDVGVAWKVKVGECSDAPEAELCTYKVAVEI